MFSAIDMCSKWEHVLLVMLGTFDTYLERKLLYGLTELHFNLFQAGSLQYGIYKLALNIYYHV